MGVRRRTILPSLLARLLERGGHQVVATTNGAGAVMEVQRQPIDVVVMDVEMPVLDGIEASQYIRALPVPLCNTPIIGISATHSCDDCLAAGMNAYVPKPVDVAALFTTIEGLRRSYEG